MTNMFVIYTFISLMADCKQAVHILLLVINNSEMGQLQEAHDENLLSCVCNDPAREVT